jgi:hypothetical protein
MLSTAGCDDIQYSLDGIGKISHGLLQSVVLDVYYDYNETVQHQTKGAYNG